MWLNLLISIGLSYIASLFREKTPPPQAGTIQDSNVPITEEGAEVGINYGTNWIDSPQITYYGDFETKPVTTTTSKK